MKASALLAVLVCAGLPAPPAAAGAADLTPRPAPAPVLAQVERCGPQPMKPMSCLSGTWLCRCYASGQICEWELVGCGAPGSLPPRPGEAHPPPAQPDDPARPAPYGR